MLYEDGRARLWDVSVGEFRRSAVKDKVPEMIGEGPVMWCVILMTRHHALSMLDVELSQQGPEGA
jgi:hypothetical protein